MKRFLTLMLAFLTLTVLPAYGQEKAPKNVILMIGDGMGLAQVSALRARHPESVFERFRVAGFVDTHPAGEEWVTDSAAAATAVATGCKVVDGVVSQDADGKPLKTVLEYAEAAGKATGMVTTCSITHATPAAFYSHVKHRDSQAEIAVFLPNSGLDVYFGGGWGWFVPRGTPGSKRSDDQNPLAELTAKGFVVLRNLDEFGKLDPAQQRVIALMAPDALPKAPQRNVTSAQMTTRALVSLASQEKRGFFLMVEGSQIDWACHENSRDGLMGELSDFEGAVNVAYAFAQKHPDTLLIVTADHETGGLVIDDGKQPETAAHLQFTRHGHSGSLVPLLACGPGSERFGGIQQNSDLGAKLIRLVEEP